MDSRINTVFLSLTLTLTLYLSLTLNLSAAIFGLSCFPSSRRYGLCVYLLSCFICVLSCVVLRCLVLSCAVLSCRVLSRLVVSCLLVLSCLVLSCRVVSCRVLTCLVSSCFVLLCDVLVLLLCIREVLFCDWLVLFFVCLCLALWMSWIVFVFGLSCLVLVVSCIAIIVVPCDCLVLHLGLPAERVSQTSDARFFVLFLIGPLFLISEQVFLQNKLPDEIRMVPCSFEDVVWGQRGLSQPPQQKDVPPTISVIVFVLPILSCVAFIYLASPCVFLTLSCLVVSCRVLSCVALSCLVLPCLILSKLTLTQQKVRPLAVDAVSSSSSAENSYFWLVLYFLFLIGPLFLISDWSFILISDWKGWC